MSGLKSLLVLFVFLTFVQTSVFKPSHKIDPKLLPFRNSKIDILVSFSCSGEAEKLLGRLSVLQFGSRLDRLNAVSSSLKVHSSASQQNVLDFLQAKSKEGQKIRSIWITNQIAIKFADMDLISSLAEFPEICGIQEDERIPLETYFPTASKTSINKNGIEWHVADTRAPDVWAAENGTRGEGAVIATIDTGVRVTHEILASSYLGDYGWYDPHELTALPVDGNGQGTHRMGVIVGSNGFGIADGAKWSSCRGCDDFSCPVSYLLVCGEFMVCPTLPNGTNPDCSKAPHIVSGGFIGVPGNNFYDDVIRVWQSVGIIPLFSVGNSGSSCQTIRSPADSIAGVIGVGSTIPGGLAVFSGRGPSHTSLVKPDILAPGGLINSSSHLSDTGYTLLQGTSANAITSGVIALLKSVNLESSYEQVKQYLCQGADRNLTSGGQECGGVPDNVYPNNVVGCGKVDAYQSFNLVKNSTLLKLKQ